MYELLFKCFCSGRIETPKPPGFDASGISASHDVSLLRVFLQLLPGRALRADMIFMLHVPQEDYNISMADREYFRDKKWVL